MSQFLGYWNYYANDFDWPDGSLLPRLDVTRQIFSDLGIQQSEAEALIASGYVNVRGDTIIDRYYGGALMSSDGCTRIDKRIFKEWYEGAKTGKPLFPRPIALTIATSLSDLENQIRQIESNIGRRLVFRGQTVHHETSRAIKNPFFLVEGLGEVSLVPSIWRNLLKAKPGSFHDFSGLDILEWSKVIYSQFDMNDIDRRVQERIDKGEWLYSAQDMEDSGDQVLSRFGQVCLDLSMGMNHNLADLLSTLLQHYGLVSPYLDLSSDLRVALFFSSHKFVPSSNASTYRYVGNNGGKSILYIFRHDANEMAHYAHDRVLHSLEPLRPKRQSCVICRSSPFALNLAGLYLVAAVQLNFEIPVEERLSASDLFPDSSEDTFLAALLENCQHADRITDFLRPRADA
jgi:hypothetical protein